MDLKVGKWAETDVHIGHYWNAFYILTSSFCSVVAVINYWLSKSFPTLTFSNQNSVSMCQSVPLASRQSTYLIINFRRNRRLKKIACYGGSMICFFFTYIYIYKRTIWVGRVVSMGRRECIENLVGKPERKRRTWGPKLRSENNIKIGFEEIQWGSVDLIYLAQIRDYCQIFLTSWGTVSFKNDSAPWSFFFV